MFLALAYSQSATRTVPGAILEKLDGNTKLITGILKLQVRFHAPAQLLHTVTQYDEMITQVSTAMWQLNNFAFITTQKKGSPIDDLMNLCFQEVTSLQT